MPRLSNSISRSGEMAPASTCKSLNALRSRRLLGIRIREDNNFRTDLEFKQVPEGWALGYILANDCQPNQRFFTQNGPIIVQSASIVNLPPFLSNCQKVPKICTPTPTPSSAIFGKPEETHRFSIDYAPIGIAKTSSAQIGRRAYSFINIISTMKADSD